MPLVFDPNKDEDEDEQAGAEAGGPSQVVGAQGGLVQGGGAGQTTPQKTAAGAPTRSGSWTNLQSYLTANQGQDARMGEQVKGAASAVAGTATGAQGTFKTNATNAIQSGSVADSGVIAGLSTDPTKVDKGQFQKQVNATYSGPDDYTHVDGYEDAKKKTTSTTQLADQVVGGHDDRATVLARKDVYGRPSYTSGEKNLDSFLLGSGAAGRQSLNDIQQSYGSKSGFQTGWQDMQNAIGGKGDAASQIGQAAKTTAETQAATRKAWDDATKTLGGRFDGLSTEAYDKSGADYALYENILKGDAGALSGIGMDDATRAYLAENGFDFGSLVDGGADYTLGDLASEGDVASWQALAGLAEGTPAAVGMQQFDFTKGGGKGSVVNQPRLDFTMATAALGGAQGRPAQIAHLRELGFTDEQINLSRELGIDPLALLDQSKAASNTLAVDMNQKGALLQLTQGDSELQAAVGRANKRRTEQFENARGILASNDDAAIAELIGIPPWTAAWFRESARRHGKRLEDFVTPGRAVTIGDAASDHQRGLYGSMLSALGGKGADRYVDPGDEGEGFTIDLEGIQALLLEHADMRPESLQAAPAAPDDEEYDTPASGGAGRRRY